MDKQLTDEELLDAIVAAKEKLEALSSKEAAAFEDMNERVASGAPLSKKQRAWIQGVAERLGIQVAPAQNLFSEMEPDKRQENLAYVRTKLPWEQPEYVKPLKPPRGGA
jgi:hypothetical protein